ncbi:MAG: hypothetical protein GC178_04485 [Flavobacteriales bacterium]|nr:hypothetical protein [Flavobacteriales bacterium]
MKNIILFLSIAILSVSQSLAQDRLFFLSGDETDVKITEVTSSEVKYKRMDNLEGPTFSTLKSELFMIKYANGTKEMITASAAPEPAQQEQPIAPAEEYTTQDAGTTETAPSSSGGGLSSGVQVTDEPVATTPTNVDKWGRTEAENRSLYKKKIIKGAVVLGVGAVLIVPGVVLFSRGVYYDDLNTTSVVDYSAQATAFRVAGAICVVGGTAMLIAGAAVMGSSAKYKKRANLLANGTARLSPVLLNDTHYSGVNVRSNPGFGVSFSYNF